ncbi:unnamed protein product [Arabis nemorensis]|uniref:Protein kinase domain-containing protein n=1 Tax=Arabis nemorensis TaxID=586526 RepID=A0A565AS57_9BRAS|nr:unnamed protein product [Arabis nemorensis]
MLLTRSSVVGARKLEDCAAAEQYYVEIGRPDAFMQCYVQGCCSSLNNHGESLDHLQKLSPDMPLKLASDTILRMMRARVHHHRQGQENGGGGVKCAMGVDSRLARLEERSRHVQRNDESLCDSCYARLGTKLFAMYPDDTIVCYKHICVWVLDKHALSEAHARAGLSEAAEDSFLDLIRADGGKLVRLRHPGVVHVVQALGENKNAMAMVTEPLFYSVANALGNVENVNNVPKDLKAMKVLVTLAGSWKLAGFGFAISEAQAGNLDNEYEVEGSILPLQPSLNYIAPELVRRKTSSAGVSSDIFSFGCLAYHLVARKPLFDCQNNAKMYMNTLNYLTNETFSSIPLDLVSDLLSMNESFGPTSLDFTRRNTESSWGFIVSCDKPYSTHCLCTYILDYNLHLQDLIFSEATLDYVPSVSLIICLYERDNMQKSEFLKALSDMWKDFDSRVLR